MTVLPAGSITTANLTVPNLFVQLQTPQQVLINGVPTNIIGMVGTASWGPTNSPTPVGSVAEYNQNFGPILTNKYDMGTHVAAATQQSANSMLCVRVSDGTDVAATVSIDDVITSANIPGMVLTALYTGTVGNTLSATIAQGTNSTTASPTFKLSIALPNSIPQIFDNIGGSGNTFWQNMVNAVNLGVSGIQGPSTLVVASLASGIGSLTVTTPGSYTQSSTNAAASPLFGALSTSSIPAAGSGYVINDTITLAGGTFTQAAVLKVATVSSGGVATVTVVTPGNYSVLPANPVAQGSTSGSGTGATFDLNWALVGATITNPGSGYTSAPTVTVSSGSGAYTANVGSTNAPALSTYVLSGGTNGITGVTDTSVVGQDTVPRKGMYALRQSGASIVDLCDVTGSSNLASQVAYGLSEGSYMISVGPAGQSIASAIGILSSVSVDSYALKYLMGDWIYWNDVYNNQIRLISPQGFVAGMLSIYDPSQSGLNKPIYGIVATQKTYANQVYSQADLQNIATGRVDLVTSPAPGGNYFALRFGKNASSNPVINGDNYTRMTNYLAFSFDSVMGVYIGQLQTSSEQLAAQNALQSFLGNLQSQGLVAAFQVVLNSSNNPASQVALGYQQANVMVQYNAVIEYFIINLEGGQTVTIQSQQVVSA
jgi:hypothetical protein